MRFFSITIPQLTIFIAILILIRIIFFFYEKDLTSRGKEPMFSLKARVSIKEWVDSIIIAGISAVIIVQFIAQPFYIPSESMYPTLKKWDFILVNKFVYRFTPPKHGDIIVFNPPPEANAGDKEYIKRLIGTPGDNLEIKNGALYRNGKKTDEPYVQNCADYTLEKITVPPDKYFMLGDNRSNSGDSHIWGFLPKKNVAGKAFIILWPPSRISILK